MLKKAKGFWRRRPERAFASWTLNVNGVDVADLYAIHYEWFTATTRTDRVTFGRPRAGWAARAVCEYLGVDGGEFTIDPSHDPVRFAQQMSDAGFVYDAIERRWRDASP